MRHVQMTRLVWLIAALLVLNIGQFRWLRGKEH